MWRNLSAFLNHPPSYTTGAAFGIISVLFGAWITRIPDIQAQTNLSEGALGLALLGMPVGAIIAMPFLGNFIARIGTGKVTFYAVLFYCGAMMLPALSFNFWTLAGALLVIGLAVGATEVAINAAASFIEKRDSRSIMSTCHACFSFGGMLGAGIASLIAGWEIPANIHLVVTALLMMVAVLILRKSWLLIEDQGKSDHRWAWPKRSLMVLAAIGFCVLLSEGAIADWSAVYLKNTLQGSSFISGLGFAGFSLTMTLGRLYGDVLIPKWGGQRLVIWGGIISAIALAVALFIGDPIAAIVGFTIVGLSYSCIVPIIFSAGANAPGVSAGAGIAAIASMGYIGFMVGPPAIGFLAEAYGLQVALGFVAGISLLFGILGSRMRLN